MVQKHYDVFISYTRADYVDAEKNVIPGNPISVIKEAFDNAGITYWFDEDGVYAGDTFAPVIARAIHSCDIFLYVSSERSNSSEWTSNEIATAYAYKKKIIPFRVDDSLYNESVIIFIAKLDYIDYASNHAKAIYRLVSGVTEYLTHQKALAAEKARKDKAELERIRIQKEKEQAELASEVELSAGELNTDEGRALDKRRRVTRDVLKIENEEIRNRLIELIDQSGPIHVAHKVEHERMSKEIGTLKEVIQDLEENKKRIFIENDARPRLLKRYKFAFIVACALLLFLSILIGIGVVEYNSGQEALQKYEGWIIKNSLVSASLSTVEYGEPPYRDSRGYFDIPTSIHLDYTVKENIPVEYNDRKIKLKVKVEFEEYEESSYWEFLVRDAKANSTEVHSYHLIKKLISQEDFLLPPGHDMSSKYSDIPIIVSFYNGESLLCETVVEVRYMSEEKYNKSKLIYKRK